MSSSVSLAILSAKPGLRAAEQREADEAAHYQTCPFRLEVHLRSIDLPVVGIKNLAPAPAVAVRAHVAQDLEADDALPSTIAGAVVADGIGVAWAQDYLDHSDQLAVAFVNLHQRGGRSIHVADRAPHAHRARLGRGNGRSRHERHQRQK